jgi:hypothetical protein
MGIGDLSDTDATAKDAGTTSNNPISKAFFLAALACLAVQLISWSLQSPQVPHD